MDELKRLIALIDERLADSAATRPGTGASTDDCYAHVKAAAAVAQSLIDDLATNHKAHFRRAGDAYRLAMAGVASECTSSLTQLLRNWQNAARRRIEGVAR